jgi:membrane protein implicated in regulation of membrane protease activity
LLSGLRVAYLSGAVLLLVGLPVGDATALFALLLALDVVIAVLVLRHLPRRQPRPQDTSAQPVIAAWVGRIGAGHSTVQLMRRTAPELRMRRPANVIAVQARWRMAAAARGRDRAAS